MIRDIIISTSRLNSYGTRVLTTGINIEQYRKNPILLYMHRRGDVIGRIENIRIDEDRLIGTPVFDMEDDNAAKIAKKWENGFLNMCSGGFEPLELSNDPKHMVPGQTRSTIVRSVLVEVSIADIGSNDDALRLYSPEGKLLTFALGVESDQLPLLEIGVEKNFKTNIKTFNMNKILLKLGLSETSTEDEAVTAIETLQNTVATAKTTELARITTAVDNAIEKDNKALGDKREFLINLGKTSGFDTLQSTLGMLAPIRKPSDIINRGDQPKTTLTFSKMNDEELVNLRENNPEEYSRVYREEFGFSPDIIKNK